MATATPKRPDLSRFYAGRLDGVTPGDFEFRLLLIRSGVQTRRIDDLVTSFSWGDEGESAKPYLTGELTVNRPDPGDAATMPIGNGHRVRCEVWWNGGWYQLWTMRVYGVPTVDLGSGELSVTLADDLDSVRRGRRRWRYRKTKSRKHGWLPQEVTRDVARKLGLKVGGLAKGRHRVSFSLNGTGFDAIRKAYAHETEKTGIDYWLRSRDGKLDVVPFRRNTVLYVIRDEIVAAMVAGEQRIRPVTVIRATGRTGKGKGSRKVKYTAFDPDVVRRFGRSEEEWDAGRVASVAELKSKAKRRLANKIRVRRTADLTIPGIPFIRRADGMRWITSEAGWHGSSRDSLDRSYVFVTSVRHTVTDVYTTQLSLQQEDPYVKDQAKRDAEKRKRARERRKGRKQ